MKNPKLNLVFLAVSAVFAEGAFAQALPTGGSVAAGDASIAQTSTSLTVTQTSQRAVYNWSTFNIGQGGSVRFDQPGASSIAVSRVSSGGGQSNIDGALSSNGNLMILNPNGVLFGAHASVNVAGLIASTGDINPANGFADFMAGGAVAITGATGGAIANQGNITVTGAGLAAFVAPSVSNAGIITATSGRITLASAQAATISLNGGLYEIAVNQGVAGGSIANTGTLSAAGGAIVLSALDAANVVSGAINLEGIQQASRIEVDGGHVALKSDLNAPVVTGSSRTIDVCGCAHVQDGIDIAAAGATVNVFPGQYTETAQGRSIGIAGIYDLGLLIDKDGLTLRGVDGSGNPITSAADVQAWITAGTSTNFGMNMGVVADNVTIQGLGFKPYAASPNKTIEIAGDNFTFRNSVVDNRTASGGAGALYFGELIAGPAGEITKLNVSGSVFYDGSVSVQNGVGVAADGVTYQPAADRVISGNTFIGSSNYRFGGVLLTGQMAEIPWRPLPIGAATVTGNSFSGFDESVLVRGAQQGVDLRQVMRDNTFDRSVLVTDAAGNARGETYQSTPDGVHFTPRVKYSIQSSIQAGIDRAVNGDTVTVGSGTYVQTVTLNVNKSVTLTGAGEANTTIDARGVTSAGGGYGMLVNADNVSLSNFTLYGPTVDAASAYGIKVQPAGSAASSRLANFSISNVTSRGAGRAELDLNGVLGASIDHVTANGAPVGNDSGTTKGAGIQLTDSANVTIANSTTRNNAWGGVALFESNRFFDQQTSNVSVSSSNVFTESNPLYLQNDSASRTFGTLTLEGFNFVVRNSDTASNNNQFTFLQYGLAGALDLAENLSAPGSGTVQGWNGSAATHDFYVGFGNLLGGGTRALSIGTALNASSSGDTLNIGSGRFAEDVVITSPRNLRFDGSTVHSLVINGSGSGIAGSVTADGGGITFNAPAVLLGNTSLSTMGANIAFNGDLQNAGGTAFALGLSAGMGDIAMVSGGTSTNPLGALTVAANDFSLTGTLWVTTFNFNMSGNVALSNHSLHATVLGATNVLQAGGSVTGTTVSASPIVVSAGGDVTMNVDAPSGSTIVAAGHADVDNIGTGIVTVNGVPMLGADIAANADNSRVIPPDSALPKDFTLPTPPTGGGQREIQVVADAAGDAIDQGFSVEIDLRPGRRRPR